jgi:hypothetical protein
MASSRSTIKNVSDFRVSWSDLNQSGVQFLLTDLDLANTFMDIAENSQVQETKNRNRNNACTAHDAVLRLVGKLTPDVDQRRAIEAKLAILKTRLQAAPSRSGR